MAAADRSSWAAQAARNAMSILPFLVDPGDQVPVIDAALVAQRIEAIFQDRNTWNEAVHESTLAGEIKIWLVVP